MIIQGDCIEEMYKLEDNSVDAIITDPPYGLAFMGKHWDKMDNKQFEKFTKKWARACWDALKPGGFLLAFGGTRTYHRLVCGIEDAGFEIRDTIMWLYGSGFPKSLNIGKQIDKMADENLEVIEAKKKLGEWLKEKRGEKPQKEISKHFLSKTGGLTGCVANWELGLNLPTWGIWIKLKELLNLDERFDYLIEGRPKNYIPAEREIIGKGTSTLISKENINMIRAGAYDKLEPKEYNLTAPATPEAKQWEGWGTALKPACEPIVVARKPLSEKNVALNVLKWGTGGINIDECRIGFEKTDNIIAKNPHTKSKGTNSYDTNCYGKYNPTEESIDYTKSQGRFPANIILDKEAGKMLGEPSRFFYCAKASKSERNFGCEEIEEKSIDIQQPHNSKNLEERYAMKSKNNHPTVKPIKLMEYLVKLISREGATVLDPFLGSGTTMIACLKLNRKCIGIEKEEEYIKIAHARIKPYKEQKSLVL